MILYAYCTFGSPLLMSPEKLSPHDSLQWRFILSPGLLETSSKSLKKALLPLPSIGKLPANNSVIGAGKWKQRGAGPSLLTLVPFKKS